MTPTKPKRKKSDAKARKAIRPRRVIRKKPVVSKSPKVRKVARKAAAKKTPVKKRVRRKVVIKAVRKKPVARKRAVRKPIARKVVTKKLAVRKRPAKPRPVARKKAAAKKTVSKKLVATKATIVRAKRAPASVGRASSRTVRGASLPRVPGRKLPPKPADKMSAPQFQRGSKRVSKKVRASRAVPISKILAGLAGKRAASAKEKTQSARKVAAAPPTAKPSEVRHPESRLPEAYGTQELVLVARDPRWLYARWDFTREQMLELNELAEAGHLSLRVFEDSLAGKLVKQADLKPDSRYWFVPVTGSEVRYVAELGYETPRGGWVAVAVSNVATTPADTVAPDRGIIFATLPMHLSFTQIMESLGAAIAGEFPLVEAIRQFQAAGIGALAQDILVSAPARHWTPEQARELDRYMGAETIRRRMRGELSSLAAAQILPPDDFAWEELGGAPELADWSDSPTSPGGGWSGDLLCVEE